MIRAQNRHNFEHNALCRIFSNNYGSSADVHICMKFQRQKIVLCKGGGTGGARGAIAPPLFTDHLKIINYSDTQNGS